MWGKIGHSDRSFCIFSENHTQSMELREMRRLDRSVRFHPTCGGIKRNNNVLSLIMQYCNKF